MKQIIFLCQTPYHLVVSASYCMKMQDKSIRKILVFDNTSSYTIVPEKVCPYYDLYINIPGNQRDKGFFRRQWFKLVYEGYFWKWTSMKKIDGVDVDENIFVCYNDGNKIFDRIATLISKKKHKIIMVEEGIGIYCKTRYSSDDQGFASRIWNKYCLGVSEHDIEYLGDDDRINTFIIKEPEKFLKEKIRGRKILKQGLVDYTVFDALIERELGDKSNVILKEDKWLLYVGDPFDDATNLPDKVETIYLKRLFDFIKKQGYFVIVKPHPRENVDKYKCFDDNNILDLSGSTLAWVPMECLVNKLKPEIVLSPCSSSMAEFLDKDYCKKVVFIYRLFPPVKTIPDVYYQQLVKEHEKVYVVKDYEELGKLLEDRN